MFSVRFFCLFCFSFIIYKSLISKKLRDDFSGFVIKYFPYINYYPQITLKIGFNRLLLLLFFVCILMVSIETLLPSTETKRNVLHTNLTPRKIIESSWELEESVQQTVLCVLECVRAKANVYTLP